MSDDSSPTSPSDQPADFLPGIEHLLASLNDPKTAHNPEQMDAIGAQLLQAASQYAVTHPDPDQSLQAEFDILIGRNAWTSALEKLDVLIERALARSAWPQVLLRRQKASTLLRNLGRTSDALAMARLTTESARQIQGVSIPLVMALEQESFLLWQLGDTATALTQVGAALEELGMETSTELPRARLLVGRARCHITLGDLREAEADLDASFPVLNRMADSYFLAGAQSGLAGWHQTRAQLSWARGERTEAIAAQRAGISCRQRVNLAPQIEPYVSGPALADAWWDLAEMLNAAGEITETQSARTEAGRIREELGLKRDGCRPEGVR